MRCPKVPTLVAKLAITREQASLIRRLAKAVSYDSDDDLRELIRERCPETFAYSLQCFHDPFNGRMWRTTMALHAIDRILGTHGVEGLGQGRAVDGFAPPYEYCNTGDSYATTLVYKRATDNLFVSSWGDIAERGRL